MLTNLYLDIETIPAQRPDVMEDIRAGEQAALEAAIAAVKAPGNYGAEAAAKWMAEKGQQQIAQLQSAFDTAVDEAYRKTGLDGSYGQIAVGSFAVDDGEPVKLWNADWRNPEAESAVLYALHDELSAQIPPSHELSTQIVGHNVASFDLRFITQRSIVKGIRPHPIIARAAMAKPWEVDKVYDTMVQWAGVGNRVKLDKLCKALDLPCKGDIDGSKVWDYIKDGRIAEVADYCADDVRRVRLVHQRMTFKTGAVHLNVCQQRKAA